MVKADKALQRMKWFREELTGLVEEMKDFDDELEAALVEAYDAGHEDGLEEGQEG